MTKSQMISFMKDKIAFENAVAKQAYQSGEMTTQQAIARKSFINGMEYALDCLVDPFNNGFKATK